MSDTLLYLCTLEMIVVIITFKLGDYMYRKRNIKTKLTTLIHDIMWIEYEDEDDSDDNEDDE